MTSEATSKKPLHQSENSKFHWLFAGDVACRHKPYDSPMMESENFVVLPSLGSIVPGWLLVVPKWPTTRIADIGIGKRGEFESLVAKSRAFIEQVYGECFMFEHGGYSGSLISCGVDQAHLHVVPLDFDLIEKARIEKGINWNTANRQLLPYDFAGQHEYWYASSKNGSIFGEVSEPESQWFRKLIAENVGLAKMWDYKEFEFAENIQHTITAMEVHG